MANVPVTEVVQVDAALDALEDPTSSQVWDAVEEFSDTAIAVSAARRSLSPSGGSQPGVPRLYSFPFSFDTPGLEDGVTIVAQTSGGHTWAPAVDDIVLDAWFEPASDGADAFDGTSIADIGRIAAGVWDGGSGWFAQGSAPGLVSLPELASYEAGGVTYFGATASVAPAFSLVAASAAAAANPAGTAAMRRLTTDDPVSLVVSADGNPGGGATEATSGAAVLRLLVVTP